MQVESWPMKMRSLIPALLVAIPLIGVARTSAAQEIAFSPSAGTAEPGQNVTVTATGNWPTPPTIFCTTDGSPANIAATLVGSVGSGGGSIPVLEGTNQTSQTINCVAAVGAVPYQGVNESQSGWKICVGNSNGLTNGTPTAVACGGVGNTDPTDWEFQWGAALTEQLTGGDNVQILAPFLAHVCPLCDQPAGTQVMIAQSKTVVATADLTMISNNEMDMQSVDATNTIGGVPVEHNFGLQCEQSAPASNPGFWAIDGVGKWIPTTVSDHCPWPINTPINVVAQGWWTIGDTGCGGNGCFNVMSFTVDGNLYDLSGTTWVAGFPAGTIAQPGEPGWTSFFGLQDQIDLSAAGGTAGRTVTNANVTEAYYTANPVTASATYTAAAPQQSASLSSTSLNFGNVSVGGSSSSQVVTLTNNGTAPISITSISVTGTAASSFTFANSCGSNIAVNASCTVHGHFTPAASGTLNAAITISESAGSSSQSIALSGTGIGPPAVALSATRLTFNNVNVGSSSASQTVTVTNTGAGRLSITSISLTGPNASSFAFANSCGSGIAAGASCTIHGHFMPTAAGTLNAAITISDNVGGSPQTIALSGTGNGPPSISLSGTVLNFSALKVGSASASQSVTLTNTGTGPLAISSITLAGANASSFVFANSCGSSLAGGANCSIHGHFAPTATGSLTATIVIADNAGNSPQSITLSGTGQ